MFVHCIVQCVCLPCYFSAGHYFATQWEVLRGFVEVFSVWRSTQNVFGKLQKSNCAFNSDVTANKAQSANGRNAKAKVGDVQLDLKHCDVTLVTPEHILS